MKKRAAIIFSIFFSIASFAAKPVVYDCRVSGDHTSDGVTVDVDVDHVIVNVNARESTPFGRKVEPEHDFNPRMEAKAWYISIKSDPRSFEGGENPMILTLNAPNQNGAIGYAHAQKNSKYIGFIQMTDSCFLEALCKKNE